ncbi:PAS domain-containing sensor histidine kinase [Phenylobacterium sp. J367]|uniref:PAS domain-containing sensor histidine kinase n=1 Tax=Phenylobacterium sp. J367 TaxID=2898435 RepID=UPI002150C874|nr:HWE histidine kinase domain-containing protein [Phenylobacterium sp. J367]MCR5879183.1 PAS domain-containing protein [Phenylobacterium sp. J367]
MGERMRAHDWSTSSLGPPETWPQSLRTTVSILLNSGHPMFVAWGPDLGFIYNDAYAVILGDKHPDALGRPFADIWADIWTDILPLIETALSGEATWSEDLYLRMFRHGYWEDTWWTFSYSPVRGESGGVGGMFCACTETTAKVVGERRLKFQLALGERLRPLTAPGEIKGAATRLLGEVLSAGRVGFAEMEADESWLTIEDDWAQGDLGPIGGRYRLEDFGQGLADCVRANRVLRVDDVETDPITAGQAANFAAIGIRAVLGIPLVKAGRLVALLSVNMAAPHAWTDDDEAMAQEVVERTWGAVQRARAENRLRENEERLRMVQAAGGVGSFDWDMVSGRIHRSAEYLELQGLSEAAGDTSAYTDDWLTRIHAEDRDQVARWFQEDRARTGPFDREYRIVRPSDGEVRWIHNRGRIDADAAGRAVRLLSVQTDITDRKRDEARQRLLINELNHRVKNTLAAVQSIAGQTLRNAPSVAQARSGFESRLMALSRAHDVLTRRTWEGAEVAEIVAGVVQSFGADSFEVEGPNLNLPPGAALSLAMALHELGTNAAKYGALSVAEGRVAVRWEREDGALQLVWQERGGPPVVPPTRQGFGSRLIERGLPRELGGRARLEFAPGGVLCEICVPLPDDASRRAG